MHDEVITDRQREGLEVLRRTALLSRFYLVGGTAAALHLGHRLSVDFDLFTEMDFQTEEIIRTLRGSLPLEVRRQAQETLHLTFNEVPLTFLRYPYCLIDPLVDGPWGLRVVQRQDIVAMKLVAISQRGARKDFVDLYFLCLSGVTLMEGLDLLPRKYPGVRFDRYHMLSALEFFADAEKQEMPRMLVPFQWEECTAFFRREVPALARRIFRA